jgi:Toprim domain-containing protein
MTRTAQNLAHRLAREAEAVCRYYLPNGRREGGYWMIGDARNTPGRSMFVRLKGPASGKGAAGKWTDAATGEHGDLLDLIRESCGFIDFRNTVDEARHFLHLPPRPTEQSAHAPIPPRWTADSARRLFTMSVPIADTIAETYLRHRGITALQDIGALRFHPKCFYREERGADRQIWPAMIAAATEHDGHITGVQRTWLARDGSAKAPIATPRRALGMLLGHAVRFGTVADVATAGEGIETMLSLRAAMPGMPTLAALSAAHLAAILFPPDLRRLYIARDNDAAGEAAITRLEQRAHDAGIETAVLMPDAGDFNDDLRTHGLAWLRARLANQLMAADRLRFIPA